MSKKDKNAAAVELGKRRASKAGKEEMARIGRLGMLKRWPHKEKAQVSSD